MADSHNNRLATENPSQGQEQSTLDWLYNTAVSFLPSFSTVPSPEQSVTQQQQPTSGACAKTSAPVCKCKNTPK